jgi:hypothetical protein
MVSGKEPGGFFFWLAFSLSLENPQLEIKTDWFEPF